MKKHIIEMAFLIPFVALARFGMEASTVEALTYGGMMILLMKGLNDES